jgi:putative ABC transport system permease protein
VGVVGDVRSFLNEPVPPTIFLPDAQTSIGLVKGFIHWFPNSLLVRSSQDPLLISRQVVEAVRSLDAAVPIGRVESMEEVFSTSIAFHRFSMTLMCVFGGLALLLAAVGIYGVMAYSVTQRTHEIGIRMALGARRADVLHLIMKRGLGLTLGGIAAGLAGAAALSSLLAGQLYEVKPTDPLAFTLAVAALVLIACLACGLPARRATRVDPLVALRHE